MSEAEQKKRGLVKAEVIAERYDVSPRLVYKWKDEGRIPFVKIGRTIRFNLADVIKTLEAATA